MESLKGSDEDEAQIEARSLLITNECKGPKIDLSSSGLDDLDAFTVAICIYQKAEPIHSLLLGSNSITDEGLEALSNAVLKHREIQHLYLGSNFFKDPGFVFLFNALPELTKLITLSLSGLQLSNISCSSLSAALLSMENCSIRYLFLNGNCIGDEGILALSVVLISPLLNLETLHLGSNQFTDIGVKILADWLSNDSSLAKLFLNDNKLGKEAISNLAEALCGNHTLKFLSIAACGIDDEGFKPMLTCLSVNESLESLHVWGNFLTDSTAEMILEVVRKHNYNINDLQVFNNPITEIETFITELEELLAKNTVEDIEDAELEGEFEKIFKEIKTKLK